MKEKPNLDLITDVGLTNLPLYMGCEEGGMEDSGEVETWDTPIGEIKDGLSAACVEALKIDPEWNWKNQRFLNVKER